MSSKTINLFLLFQKLDYRDKENSSKKKLFGILIAYLFANTVLSYNYFISFDEKSFIILAFTSNLFLLALIVLSDFDNLFLASRSIEVLRTLPVKSLAVFKAKFLSAVMFLLFFILSSAVPQVIFFHLMDNNLIKTFAFIVSDIMFCYFSVGVLILIYIFTLRYFKAKATLILNFLQILFFVFIFYSSTLSSKAASLPKELFVRENILKYGLVKYLPQTLFSNAVYNTSCFIMCTISAFVVFFLIFVIISKNYYSLSDKVRALNSKRELSKPGLNIYLIKNFINKYVISDHYETASFYLVKNQLQNSKFLRVKYIPIIIMPVLIVVIGIITDSPNLLFFNKNPGSNSFFKTVIPVVSPSITFTLIMCARLLVSNTKILDENSMDTKWIYDSLPVKDKGFIIKGANKFIYAIFIFPVIFSITILLSFKADVSTVLYNILFISSGMYFINSVSLILDKIYPFTLESAKFNSASKFIEIFLAMLLGVILFLIQIFVFQNIIFVIISIMIFVIVSLLLNRK